MRKLGAIQISILCMILSFDCFAENNFDVTNAKALEIITNHVEKTPSLFFTSSGFGGGRDVSLEKIEILKRGKNNNEKKYIPLRIRTKGSLIVPSYTPGRSYRKEFDVIIESRLSVNDFDEWAVEILKIKKNDSQFKDKTSSKSTKDLKNKSVCNAEFKKGFEWGYDDANTELGRSISDVNKLKSSLLNIVNYSSLPKEDKAKYTSAISDAENTKLVKKMKDEKRSKITESGKFSKTTKGLMKKTLCLENFKKGYSEGQIEAKTNLKRLITDKHSLEERLQNIVSYSNISPNSKIKLTIAIATARSLKNM